MQRKPWRSSGKSLRIQAGDIFASKSSQLRGHYLGTSMVEGCNGGSIRGVAFLRNATTAVVTSANSITAITTVIKFRPDLGLPAIIIKQHKQRSVAWKTSRPRVAHFKRHSQRPRIVLVNLVKPLFAESRRSLIRASLQIRQSKCGRLQRLPCGAREDDPGKCPSGRRFPQHCC